jgi:hypothetical protein
MGSYLIDEPVSRETGELWKLSVVVVAVGKREGWRGG